MSRIRKRKLKCCSYGTCSNNSEKTSMDRVRYIPYPKPTTLLGFERAERWIINCGREGVTLENINENTYVCSQHFVDPKGPTNSNPDPIPAATPIRWTNMLQMIQNQCIQDTAKDTLEHSQINRAEIERHYCPQQDSNALLLDAITVEDDVHADVSAVPIRTGENAQLKTVVQDNNVPEKEHQHHSRYENSSDVPIMSTESTTSCPQPAIIATLHEVMLHCKGWYMNYELGNDSQITASLVKWAECRTLLTVTVVAKHETLNVSLMVDNVQIDRNHQFWSETKVENLLGLRNFLDKLSTWNICFFLRSQNNHSRTGSPNPTTCKALVQPPLVICTECKTKCRIQATNSKECAKTSAAQQAVLKLQHKQMNKETPLESQCGKINYLTKRNAYYRKRITRLRSQLKLITSDLATLV